MPFEGASLLEGVGSLLQREMVERCHAQKWEQLAYHNKNYERLGVESVR
jgi:hypothetical protein